MSPSLESTVFMQPDCPPTVHQLSHSCPPVLKARHSPGPTVSQLSLSCIPVLKARHSRSPTVPQLSLSCLTVAPSPEGTVFTEPNCHPGAPSHSRITYIYCFNNNNLCFKNRMLLVLVRFSNLTLKNKSLKLTYYFSQEY